MPLSLGCEQVEGAQLRERQGRGVGRRCSDVGVREGGRWECEPGPEERSVRWGHSVHENAGRREEGRRRQGLG